MKWSRRKDRYIGSLCLDTGSVPGEIGILPEYREGYRNPPGRQMGLLGLSGEERGHPRGGTRPPLPQSELDKGRWRRPPLLPSPRLLLPPSTSWNRKGRGKPTWSRIAPPWARLSLGWPSPPPPFIYGGRGHPKDTTIDPLIS